MNLYKIYFVDRSIPKHQTGPLAFLYRETDEEVYEWIKSEPIVEIYKDTLPFIAIFFEKLKMFNNWKEEELKGDEFEIYDDNGVLVKTDFKGKIIHFKGQVNEDGSESSNNNHILYGWEMVEADVPPESYSDLTPEFNNF